MPRRPAVGARRQPPVQHRHAARGRSPRRRARHHPHARDGAAGGGRAARCGTRALVPTVRSPSGSPTSPRRRSWRGSRRPSSCHARTSNRSSWRSCAGRRPPLPLTLRASRRSIGSCGRVLPGGGRCCGDRSPASSSEEAFEAAGIDPTRRPEELGVESWGKLAEWTRMIPGAGDSSVVRAPAKLTHSPAGRGAPCRRLSPPRGGDGHPRSGRRSRILDR